MVYSPKREKKKKSMKEVAKDISLHRPLAPPSVFLLETQAKMVICVLPFALFSPTSLTVYK